MSAIVLGYIVLGLICFVSLISIPLVPRLNAKFGDEPWSDEDKIAVRVPRTTISDNVALGAMKSLVKFANQYNPDYIFGVNHGGVLVANFLADALQYPNEKIFRIVVDKNVLRFRRDRANFDNIHLQLKDGVSAPDFENAKILIVDDISRSGSTLRYVKEHFSHYDQLGTKIKLGCLFVNKNSKEALDYYCEEIEEDNALLPWSPNPNNSISSPRDKNQYTVSDISNFPERLKEQLND